MLWWNRTIPSSGSTIYKGDFFNSIASPFNFIYFYSTTSTRQCLNLYIYIYSISNAYPLRRWWPSWHWDLKIKQSMSKLKPANEKKRKTKNFTNTQKTNTQSTHIQFQRVKCDTDRLSVSLFSFILSCDIEKCVKGDPRFPLLTV